MRRFLIDTDTASDDAVALVMALRHTDIVVEALTIVCGNVGLDQAVQNALYTVELCESSVPVHPGAAAPMMRTLETAQYVQGDCGLPLAGRTDAGGRGADVIVDTVLGSPGEITLVALGPLTNLAIAVLRAPEIVGAVERVVIMGGTGVSGPGNITANAEFNFWADPEAAAIVLRSGLPVELVGWDISIADAVVTPSRHEAMKAIGTKYSEFAIDIAQVVREVSLDFGLEGDDLPDPIAMAYAIDPSAGEVVRLPTEVMAGDGPQRGAMVVDRIGFTRQPANATIVTHYSSDHFFAMLHDALR